jgi:hypothetical protein
MSRVTPISESGGTNTGAFHRKAGASAVPKLCQNPNVFMRFGLALSEKQIPQIIENTEKPK